MTVIIVYLLVCVFLFTVLSFASFSFLKQKVEVRMRSFDASREATPEVARSVFS